MKINLFQAWAWTSIKNIDKKYKVENANMRWSAPHVRNEFFTTLKFAVFGHPPCIVFPRTPSALTIGTWGCVVPFLFLFFLLRIIAVVVLSVLPEFAPHSRRLCPPCVLPGPAFPTAFLWYFSCILVYRAFSKVARVKKWTNPWGTWHGQTGGIARRSGGQTLQKNEVNRGVLLLQPCLSTPPNQSWSETRPPPFFFCNLTLTCKNCEL